MCKLAQGLLTKMCKLLFGRDRQMTQKRRQEIKHAFNMTFNKLAVQWLNEALQQRRERSCLENAGLCGSRQFSFPKSPISFSLKILD